MAEDRVSAFGEEIEDRLYASVGGKSEVVSDLSEKPASSGVVKKKSKKKKMTDITPVQHQM